ncbi:TetR/AcrR family transcriptional regulator [Amycolatopsis anabasis]|uniref:TetR/AcrR family transcriptional regulator n=1 Tax=Amycolatopsis anabasis TaxID=1840409 RepID=UPI00131D5229|nr:TetR/AcrR family transcriptional regulator [Amycolatopsis anabasis]
MARTKPGEQRRSELLDAAESLVLRDGIDSLTVDDVTVGAGVAKGTFYLHFTNKADLIGALRDRYRERFVSRQREAARTAEGIARVEQWILAGITEYLGDIRLHDVLFQHTSRPEQPTPNLAVDALRDLIKEIGAGVPDPEAAAVVLYHAMHGTADHILHFPGDRERMLAEVTRLCRALLAEVP